MHIENIFVIGSGAMGSGIAQVLAEAGYKTFVYDVDYDRVVRSISAIKERFAKKTAKGKMTPEEAEAATASLNGTSNLKPAAEADLVIECIYENQEAKEAVYAEIQKYTKEETIIASNTSTLSITALAKSVRRPDQFIGMHFFNPVPVMKLLEITPGLATSDKTMAAAKEVGDRTNKVMIVSKDMPGFLVNRMLDPMMNEAVQLLDEGTGSVEDIDNAMKYGCNHPMGPLELADMVGNDILLAVMEVLHKEMGDSKYRPTPLLKKMVCAGWTGQKAGRGFYIYNADGTKYPNPQL
jgi:3-hydroxybutyryl-CoA dehydrogenase